MDFVRPYRVKIFRTSDSKMLSDAYGFAEPTVEHILLPQEELPDGWVLRLSEEDAAELGKKSVKVLFQHVYLPKPIT